MRLLSYSDSKQKQEKDMRRRKKGTKIVNTKNHIVDGVKLRSGLEVYMYKALKMFKIPFEYEPETYVLNDKFRNTNKSYERQSNGKGEFKDRGGKVVQSIKYTPDFVGEGFIIECKGWGNEAFPLRWKMFKKHLVDNKKEVTLYKPQSQKECDQVVKLILEQHGR